jgi:hypothetical protein
VNIINWFPLVDLNTPTNNSTLKLTIPNTYKINFISHGITDQKIDTFETTISYTFTSDYKTIIKSELFSKPIQERLPYIIIIPTEFYYGVSGKLDSWKSFGDWMFKLNSGLNDLTQNEKNAVNQLLKGIESDKEKIQTLYKYLQSNTRYVNVSIETGGLKSYPASYVCKNKFGDCKALSTYMKSLLEYVGIKSYYTLVDAGENSPQIITDFPSQQFNHVILCIPLEKDTIWMDPTLSFAPLGYIGTFTQNRYALVVDQNNSKLIKTPALDVSDVKEYFTYKIYPEDNTGTNLKISINLKGDAFEKVFIIHKSLTDKEKEEFFRQFVPLKNYQLNNWKIYENPSDYSSILVDLDITVNNYLKSYNNFKYANLIPLKIPNFEKPDKRNTDIRLNFPIYIVDKHIFEPHPGYHFRQFSDTCITTTFGIYDLKSEIMDDKLNIDRQLIIFAGEYTLSKYQSFYDFINRIKYIEKKSTVVLTQNE